MRSSAWPANERLELWGEEEELSDKRQAGTRGSELFMSTHRSGKTAAVRGAIGPRRGLKVGLQAAPAFDSRNWAAKCSPVCSPALIVLARDALAGAQYAGARLNVIWPKGASLLAIVAEGAAPYAQLRIAIRHAPLGMTKCCSGSSHQCHSAKSMYGENRFRRLPNSSSQYCCRATQSCSAFLRSGASNGVSRKVRIAVNNSYRFVMLAVM